MRRLFACLAFAAVAASLTACGSTAGNSAAPSPVAANRTVAPPTANVPRAVGSLLGTWSSTKFTPSALLVHLATCTNLSMNITSQTATQASGILSMVCPDAITVVGTITGQLGGTTIPLTWVGTTTQYGNTCPFSFSGTGVQLSADTFHIELSGNTCWGPVETSDNLRLGSSPPPAPVPGTASDMIDMTKAKILNSPLNLATWPITTALSVVEIRPNGIHVAFSKQSGAGRWPDWTPPGWDGPLQYTLGMALNINGQWYASAPIQFWYGLDASGGPPSQYAANWFYDSFRWAPMTYHQPAVGETIGIFVVAGDCRNRTDGGGSPVKERSNVVLVKMTDDRGAVYTF